MTLCLHRAALTSIALTGVLAACRPAPPVDPIPTSHAVTPTGDLELTLQSEETGEPNDPLPSATPEPQMAEISVYLGDLPETLDPAMVSPQDAAAHDLIANLFVGMATLDPDTGLVEPALAQRWERSEDGLTWTVYLRDDVSWVRINPDTREQERVRPIHSADVVRAVQRACRSEQRALLASSLFVIQGCREVFSLPPEQVTLEMVDQLLGARVLNETVLEFRLTKDTAVFPTLMAMPLLYPVPADLIDSVGEGWSEPFTLWTSGPSTLIPASDAESGYTLIASQYWPMARTGNVGMVHVIASEPEAAFEAFGSGDLAASVVPPEQVGSITFGRETPYQLQALPAVTMLAFQYDTPPMERPGMRRALSLAIDRQALIDELLEQGGVAALPALSLTPPGMAAVPAYGTIGAEYNPEAARAALSDAGYPGCGALGEIRLLVDDSALSLAMGNRIAEMWRTTLGCSDLQVLVEQLPLRDVLIFLHEPPTPIQRQFRPLRAQAIMLSWQADYPDSHHWLADILGCRDTFTHAYLNSTRPCLEADTLLAQAEATHDPTARADLYAQIEEGLFSAQGEMPVAPLLIYARPMAFQSWVEYYARQAGPLRFDRWIVNDAP